MKTLRVSLLTGLILCSLALARTLNFPRAASSGTLQRASESQPLAAEKHGQEQEAVEQKPMEFNARCRAPGVLVCQGFDSPENFLPAKYPVSGVYAAWDGVFRGTLDSTVKASGGGSLRFEIPPHSAANAAGYWRQSFGKNFGAGSTFYVQFRERFSEEMFSNDWGGTTWKQVIFHNGSQTCTDLSIIAAQYYQARFPTMNTSCGSRMIATNDGTPPYKIEQGDYNCWYGRTNSKDCFIYPADEWVTFYYRISVGHWGKPDSIINAWVARDGQPYRQWIKMPGFVLENGHPGSDYDSLTLLTYMTNKDAKVNHPTAYAWYDELIVSTQPIAPPTHSVNSEH